MKNEAAELLRKLNQLINESECMCTEQSDVQEFNSQLKAFLTNIAEQEG